MGRWQRGVWGPEAEILGKPMKNWNSLTLPSLRCSGPTARIAPLGVPRAGLIYRGALGHNKEIRAAGLSAKDAKT